MGKTQKKKIMNKKGGRRKRPTLGEINMNQQPSLGESHLTEPRTKKRRVEHPTQPPMLNVALFVPLDKDCMDKDREILGKWGYTVNATAVKTLRDFAPSGRFAPKKEWEEAWERALSDYLIDTWPAEVRWGDFPQTGGAVGEGVQGVQGAVVRPPWTKERYFALLILGTICGLSAFGCVALSLKFGASLGIVTPCTTGAGSLVGHAVDLFGPSASLPLLNLVSCSARAQSFSNFLRLLGASVVTLVVGNEYLGFQSFRATLDRLTVWLQGRNLVGNPGEVRQVVDEINRSLAEQGLGARVRRSEEQGGLGRKRKSRPKKKKAKTKRKTKGKKRKTIRRKRR